MDESKKKARTFDFMAMFEEARQTAIERTQTNLDHNEETVDPDKIEKSEKSKASKKKDTSSDSSDSDSDSSSSDDDNKKSTKKEKVSQSKGDNSDEDAIGPPLPAGYSQIDSEDAEMIGPPQPSSAKEEDNEDDESDESDEESLESKIPSSHEVVLEHGSKTVSGLALDPSGARLVTGGFDYDMKFWDFSGMDASLQSFRNLRPCECHPIKSVQYSTTGDKILVVAGNSQAKIIDRDGFEVMECARGDQYIVDMASTKGHTAMLNSGCWNPKLKEEFMTCSNDGSVRLWDVTMEGKRHKNIIKPKGVAGRRTVPTTCTYSNDGVYVAAACQDGSIQLWDHRKHTFVNVALQNKKAHTMGSDTSCLCFSYDGKVLASRGGDDTLKLWDVRKFQQPLGVVNDLTNFFSMTDCLFSPNDQMVVTGISVKKNEGPGKLLFFERQTLNRVMEMEISDSSVVRALWHPKLNQMVVGSADGLVRLYYDPKKSHRGAMLCVVKQKRKARQVQVMASQTIITPYALPMFRQGKPTSTRKQEEKVRKDPVRSQRPDLPVSGPGTGGRLGAKGATLSQYVVQTLIKRKPDKYENDPRGAILRHAKDAAENPYWVDPAYKKTQPNKVFQEPETKKEDSDEMPLWKKQKTG